MNLRAVSIRAARAVAALLVTAAAAAPLSAQTLTLTDSSATTLRGGTYASVNYSSDRLLATRASSDSSYVRRILLKFDTHNPIPLGTPIASATLTLTVAGGNSQTRTLAAYRVTTPYDEADATWTRRKDSSNWSRAGGDIAEQVASASVSATPGTRVTYNVTGMIQALVNGTYSSTSRYARFVIADAGSSSRDSYKEFYSDEAADATVRPTLTITLGSASAPAPAPEPIEAEPVTTAATLKFLHWNIHHGVGTDGVYNIDRIATYMASYNPDVISLNEVERYTGWGNEDQPERFVALMRQKTGRTWYYKFATKTGTTRGEGVMIMSRFPIEATGERFISYNRSIVEASIIVNGRRISLFSTHLDADYASRRQTQINELKSWAQSFPEARIVAADFNAQATSTEMLSMLSTYYDTWAVAKAGGDAIGYSGNTAGNTRNSRIDYIVSSKGATNLVVVRSQVFDTRNSSGHRPSDHNPLMTTFEIR